MLLDVRAWIDKVWPRAEPRKMGLWPYPIPAGGKRMTLIKLPMKMSKTAFQTDWKKCCIFKRRNMKISLTGLLLLCMLYTMIATNMQYLSFMPSGPFVLDHTNRVLPTAAERRWAAAPSTLIRRPPQQLEKTFWVWKHRYTIKMAFLMPRPPTTVQCLGRTLFKAWQRRRKHWGGTRH